MKRLIALLLILAPVVTLADHLWVTLCDDGTSRVEVLAGSYRADRVAAGMTLIGMRIRVSDTSHSPSTDIFEVGVQTVAQDCYTGMNVVRILDPQTGKQVMELKRSPELKHDLTAIIELLCAKGSAEDKVTI